MRQVTRFQPGVPWRSRVRTAARLAWAALRGRTWEVEVRYGADETAEFVGAMKARDK